MGRTENIAVFEHTRHMCNTNQNLVEAIKESNQSQEVIPETVDIEKPPSRFNEPAKVIVSRKRSFEAARAYFMYTPCVLNFASATNPGGGVERGATAQEECLCRCSTLHSNLSDSKINKLFYEEHKNQKNPLNNDDCIYTPNVVVFKTDTYTPELMHTEDWWLANVITCAAPNLRLDRAGNPRVHIEKDALYAMHVKRIRRILNIVADKGNEVIILGAFGCGAYNNPPEIVAAAMRQVISEYRYHFRYIEFAVYCSPQRERNYQVFLQHLSQTFFFVPYRRDLDSLLENKEET